MPHVCFSCQFNFAAMSSTRTRKYHKKANFNHPFYDRQKSVCENVSIAVVSELKCQLEDHFE